MLGSAIVEFSDFISEIGLLDVLLLVGLFTWSNNRAYQTLSGVDCFLLAPAGIPCSLRLLRNDLSWRMVGLEEGGDAEYNGELGLR